MASNVFTNATKLFGDGDIDWLADTIRIMLLKSSFTPDLDADIFVADVSADELGVAGYARITLANKFSTKDNANNRTDYGADNPVWAALAAGETIGWAVVFKLVTNDADSPVICVLDGADVATNGGQITLRFNGTAVSGIAFRLAA
jgi:hypothetical protein